MLPPEAMFPEFLHHVKGRILRFSTLLGVLLATLSGAAAAPASPDEAQRLTALFERYVGHGSEGRPSPVKVVPHGDAYTATLDVTRLFGFFSAAGLDVVAGDLTAELVPQDGGRWHVTVDGLPPIGVTQDGKGSSFAVDGYRFDGLFDPAMQTFASSSWSTRGSTTHMVGRQAPADITVTAVGEGTSMAADTGGGRVDATGIGHYRDFDYAVKTPGLNTSAPQALHLRAASVATSTAIEHERIVALDDLWRFLVEHPSKAALVAAQPELKTRLKAVLPFADAITSSAVLSKMTIGTPLGDFALDAVSEGLRVGGQDAAGGDVVSLRFNGLSLPDGLMPNWAMPLVPTSLDLTQGVGPVNLTPALVTLVDAMDLGADKPLGDAQQAAFLDALREGTATLTIKPSSLSTATLQLKVEGEIGFAKPMPTGTATLAATGLDKTIEAVQTASAGEPAGMQAVAMLVAAKGLAKAEGHDSYSWRIVAGPGGAVTINGVPLAGLLPPTQPEKPLAP